MAFLEPTTTFLLIATDEDRNALTKEAFNQAGVNQDVNSAYTTQQGNVDNE